jgi:adenosylmethionine---8-amino-7-oxononanoate aminotransferase
MNSASIWHPFTQRTPNGETGPLPVEIARAEGAWLETRDGRKLIDGISSWWVTLHGHSHPAIAAAIAEQAANLDHVLLAGFTHEPAEELTARLGKYLPAGLSHVFYSDDGSTAVEVGLKLAAQYWQNIGRTQKMEIVALEHAYHGDTVGAMSVADDSGFNDAFRGMRFPVHRVHSAYCYRCPVGLNRATCHIECLNKLELLLEQRHEDIAAVIVEPLLQGAGGMIVHPVEFLAGVRELCTRYEVLLIADEVLTGFGRTGRMFACELAGVTPDLMCLAKGLTGGFLPMGATVCADFIADAFVGSAAKTFWHGHSYTGNPICCAAGVASLRIFESEPVFDRIAGIAQVHQERLAAVKEHPAVGEVRQIGTIAVVELKASDAGYFSNLKPLLTRFYVEHGVVLRPLGNVVYILPPYCITCEELNRVHDVIAESLEMVMRVTKEANLEARAVRA